MRHSQALILTAALLLPPMAALAQTELEQLRAQLQALKEQQELVLAKDDALQRKLQDLARASGASLHGEFSFESVNTLRLPVNSPLTRTWPTVAYADLRFEARPSSRLRGEAVLSMQHVLASNVVSQYGVRRFSLEAETPVSFKLGDQAVRLSPLTLWAVEDDHGWEISPLARRRKEGMDRLYLGQGQWPLRGASTRATLVWGEALESELSGLAMRLAVPGGRTAGLPFGTQWPYEQWLFAAKGVLRPVASKALALGVTWVEIMDLPDTLLASPAPALDKPLRDGTAAMDLDLHLLGGVLQAGAELAVSNATPDYGGKADWTQGQAARGELQLARGGFTAKLWGLSNNETFINYAAQTRIHDSLGDQPFTTSNNLFNPATQDYGVLNAPPAAAYTRFNPNIAASFRNSTLVKNALPGGQYLSHDHTRNNSLPFGLATPNRQGGGARLGLALAGGQLQAYASGSALNEAVQPWYERLPQVGVPSSGGPRRFLRGEGGLRSERPLGLPIGLMASAAFEDTQGNTPVGLGSSVINAELVWHATRKLDLIGGLQHRDAKGGEVVQATPGTHSWVWTDVVWDSWAAELRWQLSPAALGILSYVYHDLVRELDSQGKPLAGNLNQQEAAASFRLSF